MRFAEVRTPEGIQIITEQEYFLRIFREPMDEDRFKSACCGGVGYVRLFRPLGHFEFGKVEVCQRCHPSMPLQPEGPAPWAK